ncbi:MAG: type II toxin-antitoxin system prevent-host-death family antitoxin [Acidobacteriia bacterium]|nr:type II toxin-antitoxin system prevent-host-death family antitoxin [Terriglobia bacterium]MYB53285.1 type II toxin-antitoxin system prevent-host-death family antitoxin [Terriglobia bacterium]MYG01247.1 type II toxin-antitoxin system prevent-host-death family antitoxin [Terriglobia bacterium]MYK11531.1 type II toxin-antitoxin system prevent-host-death family antitoxin [Terriglobia bacterium]
MRRASVSEAKNSLSALLNEVRRGETVLVTHHGKPVAQIRPCDADALTDEAAAKLVQGDIADPPQGSLDVAAFMDRPLPRLPEGLSASGLIAEERDESR